MKNKIVGYASSGAPITEEELVATVLEADLDIQRGNGISFSDMKKKYLNSSPQTHPN